VPQQRTAGCLLVSGRSRLQSLGLASHARHCGWLGLAQPSALSSQPATLPEPLLLCPPACCVCVCAGNFQFVILTDTAASILLMKRGRTLVTRPCVGLGQETSTGPPTDTAAAQHSSNKPTPQTPASGAQQSVSHHTSVTHGAYQGPNRLVAAVFDPQRPFRVFAVTAAGDLVLMTVPSGAAAHQCRVSAAPVRAAAAVNSVVDGSAGFTTLKLIFFLLKTSERVQCCNPHYA
jgi:hypothetical protein